MTTEIKRIGKKLNAIMLILFLILIALFLNPKPTVKEVKLDNDTVLSQKHIKALYHKIRSLESCLHQTREAQFKKSEILFPCSEGEDVDENFLEINKQAKR
jgi:hypothetical protein